MPIKSVRQNFEPNSDVLSMMDAFKDMVNHCIRIGLQNNVTTLKKLSSLAYHTLQDYDMLSYYKLNAISHAAWEGVPFYKIDPRRTSMLCPRCGWRLQEDRQRRRDLWCGNCMRWCDRDVVATMNIAYKGLHRFCNPQGDT